MFRVLDSVANQSNERHIVESKIPVPTDNVYKFYALFSLFVLIFSFGSILYLAKTTNELAFTSYVEVERLKSASVPPALAAAQKTVLEKRVELAIEDKKFFMNVLTVFAFGAIFGLAYGFSKWHKEVQPVIDQTAMVQLEIAKLQLEKLKRELGIQPSDEAAQAS